MLNNTDEFLAEIDESLRKMDSKLKRRIGRRGELVERILAAAKLM